MECKGCPNSVSKVCKLFPHRNSVDGEVAIFFREADREA